MSEQAYSGSRAWSWRHAIAMSDLPAMTRHMLLTLSLKMDETGGSCYPPISELVTMSGLDKKTVLKHLDIAEQRGWLEISQHGFRGQKWKRNEYFAKWPGRDVQGNLLAAAEADADEGGGEAPPPCAAEKVVEMAPEGGGNGSTKVVEQLHQDKILPTNIPTNIPEREGAWRREEGQGHDDRRSLTKRVKALEMGRHGNPWPGVLGSSTDWTIRQFAALDEADRAEAEAKRDAYLAVCKAQGVKPVALGNYLRDRKFLDVSTETARAAVRKVDRVTARPFGPVWGGMRAFCLGQGPGPVEMPGDVRGEAERLYEGMMRASERVAAAWRERKGITLGDGGRLVFPDDFERAEHRRRQSEDGYPLVKHLDELARDARAELVDGRNGALGELCEPVPVGTGLFDAWRDFHARMGWKLWPDPGRMPVVYLPKGGPEGFEDFMRAARAAMADGGKGDADAA